MSEEESVEESVETELKTERDIQLDKLILIINNERTGNLAKFVNNQQAKYFFRILKIEHWTPFSRFLVFISLMGIFLFTFTMLLLILYDLDVWVLNWLYTFLLIILSGFIFCKPDRKYNFILVLLIFVILAFVPSNYGQCTLALGDEFIEPVVGLLEDTGVIPESDGNGAPTAKDVADYLVGGESGTQVTGEPVDISGLYKALEDLQRNPFDDITSWTITLNHVLNWIIIIGIICIGGSTIGSVLSGDWGEIGKKVVAIAICVVIITIITFMFKAIGSDYKSPMDTLGDTWNTVMKTVGLASLDQDGNEYVSTSTVINGVFSWVPLVLPLLLLGIAIYFRKKDYDSLMFTKAVKEEHTISVERTQVSPYLVVFFLAMIIYVVGYFLVTADPQVVVDPIITLVFYASACCILFMIGLKWLILNRRESIWGNIKNTLIWFFIGMIGLFLWFQVFQPIVYNMGWIDTPTGLLTLSQNETVLESDYLEQLFLVALPETLIFQVAPVGVGNRVYFRFKKTNILIHEEKRIKAEIEKLTTRLDTLTLSSTSISPENLRKAVYIIAITRKIKKLRDVIDKGKIQKVGRSFFVVPSMISATIGSFLFSWYHSFRRGIDFVTWWQNPMLGMVYFGAGFFLCVIAFFSFPASIGVHWINNCIAKLLSGA